MPEPTTYPLVTIQPAASNSLRPSGPLIDSDSGSYWVDSCRDRPEPGRCGLGTLPYPYHVQPDGTIARQDFWKGNPAQLAGFQHYPETQTVDLECEDFLTDPEQSIGMYPVFITDTDDMFTLTAPIESVHVKAAAHPAAIQERS